MKTYHVKTFFGEYDVTIQKKNYRDNGNLALQLWEPEEGPFATLTVNLGKKLPANQAFVDTNNCPWGEEFIEENGLGKDTGKFGFSGYCVYPLYEFDEGVLADD